MATPRQLAYIERLGTDAGATIEKSMGELTMMEASELIVELLQKANVSQNGKEVPNRKGSFAVTARKNEFGAGARLGMAFKCIYRNWVSSGVSIFKNRKVFTKDVLQSYKLINEIAERAPEKGCIGDRPLPFGICIPSNNRYQ